MHLQLHNTRNWVFICIHFYILRHLALQRYHTHIHTVLIKQYTYIHTNWHSVYTGIHMYVHTYINVDRNRQYVWNRLDQCNVYVKRDKLCSTAHRLARVWPAHPEIIHDTIQICTTAHNDQSNTFYIGWASGGKNSHRDAIELSRPWGDTVGVTV